MISFNFLFRRFKMKKTSFIWCILMFVSIRNHPIHIIYVFRYFWLDFMLLLTSKLLKNVNFGLLDHFGQRVLNTCVCVTWPNTFLGAYNYLSQVPFPKISCPEMQNSSWGGRKTIFFFFLQPLDGITTFNPTPYMLARVTVVLPTNARNKKACVHGKRLSQGIFWRLKF